ncbi:MAG UNVERIFIED_CONTAM: metallophosphoesterase family protein [Planctomycetaceae bacterium]|jgi:diadenosine tetraphosphatase ApaH/serine/threonine PP2A family protein phosphatase
MIIRFAQRVTVRPAGTFRRISAAMRPHHFSVLRDEHLSWLARMPVTTRIELDGLRFVLVHATPRDPMDEYLEAHPELWRQRLQHIDADFVCVGHTHIPMQLRLDSLQVINPGSVGQPRDGDPRAAYAIIEKGKWNSVAAPITSISQSAECGRWELRNPLSHWQNQSFAAVVVHREFSQMSWRRIFDAGDFFPSCSLI